MDNEITPRQAFTYSKLTIETLEQDVKYTNFFYISITTIRILTVKSAKK